MEISREFRLLNATIASGATTSNAIDATPYATLAIVIPSAITATAISFLVSVDNTTYQALYDGTNTIISLPVSASRSYPLPEELASWQSFKIVCNATEGAARAFSLVAKG